MVNNLVVCGGTFDHFHKGHEKFLNFALSIGRKIIVGLTSDKYLRNSKFIHSVSRSTVSSDRIGSGQDLELIETFTQRENAVLEFVKKEQALDRIELIKIDDLFGPTLSKDLLIDAVVVSDDSKKGADIINQRRKELGLSLLKVLVASPVKAEDGKLISSARIRDGEINRVGRLYVKPAWLKTDLVLPEDLRQKFKEPMGVLYQEINPKNEKNSPCIISVGDETSKKFNENSVRQNISVVDFKVARKEKFSSFSELGFEGNENVITVSNPRGHITSDLFNAILKVFKSDFKNRIILKVTGEEDLAVLPLILAAPLGTIICYGQPNKGLVKVTVSTTIKDRAYDLVSKLRPI